MAMIIGFITSAIGRYILIAVAGLGLMAYMRYDARAPLQDALEQMREAAAHKEKIAEADRRRAEAAESELARLDATLESLIHETKASSCRLDAAELESLRRLAR